MRETILDQFNRDGFYVIDDFLTPEETEELHKTGKYLCIDAPKENRKIFSTTNAESNQNRENYFLESGDKIRYFFEKDAVGQEGDLLVDPIHALNKVGHALHTEHPTFNKITFSNRVKEVCWQLGYKRPAIPQSMYIFKNPGIGGEVIAHQDSWFLQTEPNSVVGFWIALEDSTLENGCLQFIRGSHTSGAHRRYMRNPDPSATELLVYDRMAPIYPESNFTAIPVKKGACILIHGQVVHKSDINRSKQSRHAYTFHVIETDDVQYSKDNWLQPLNGKPFPLLYKTQTQ